MITDADIKKMKEVFATKDNLKGFASNEYVDKRFERLFKYLDHRFEPLDNLVREFADFKDKVLTDLDWLMGKYTKFEDEHIVLTEQTSRVNEKLDNHEARIVHLEQRVATP